MCYLKSAHLNSVCNFQSIKSPVELNSLLLNFFRYITWFVISPDLTRLWTTCKRGLYVKSFCFFETIASWIKNCKLNFPICKILRKNKTAYTWDQKCLISVFFWLKFKTTIFIFEMSTIKFIDLQNFAYKKCLDLRPKMSYLCIFRLEFWKTILIFKINTLKLASLKNFAKNETN